MRHEKYISRLILYTAANRIIHYEGRDYSLPIFIMGDVIYDELMADRKLIPFQEYIFPLSWQLFFNSLISDDYKTILIDAAILTSSIFISENLFGESEVISDKKR